MATDHLGREVRRLQQQIQELQRRSDYPSMEPDADWNAVGDPGQPAYENGWSTFPTWPAASFRVDSEGWVIFRGLVQNGVNHIFTLPAAYRPPRDASFTVMSNGPNIGHVTVNSISGQVSTAVVTTGWVSLTTIRYPLWGDDQLRFRVAPRIPRYGLDYTTTGWRRPRLYVRRNGFVDVQGICGTWQAIDFGALADLSPEGRSIHLIHGSGTAQHRVDAHGILQVFGNVNPYGILGGTVKWPTPAIEPYFTDFTLQNGWQWFADYYASDQSGYPRPAYYKDNDGYVHLRGLAIHATPSGSTIATLPAGYRPGDRTMWPVLTSLTSPGRLDIDPSGTIHCDEGYGTGIVAMDGVTFLAEN